MARTRTVEVGKEGPEAVAAGSLNLMIVGGSARWAAESSRRAGWYVVAADHFMDCDLIAACTRAFAWDGSRQTLLHLARAWEPDAWCYVGGLENRPNLVAALSREVPLWGTPADRLKTVRDPDRWPAFVARAGWDVLVHRRQLADDDWKGRKWLEKPRSSTGGVGVRGASRGRAIAPAGSFFQEFWPGTPYAAAYVGTSRRVVLLGVTRQWSWANPVAGRPRARHPRFLYGGSVGPVTVAPSWREMLFRLGRTLTFDAGLRGLFGVDFVACGQSLRVVEINPRPTASMEVLEEAAGRPWMAWQQWSTARRGAERKSEEPAPRHESAAERSTTPATRATKAIWHRVAKRIVYAPADFHTDRLHRLLRHVEDHYGVAVRDLPREGIRIRTGGPVVSLLARGESEEEVVARGAAAEAFIAQGLLEPA